MTEQFYDHKGTHATADIMLNEYPKNAVSLFKESLKYSNLNIVSEKIHQFTDEAATGVYVLSESSASIHEYPENNYITVDCYTCGKEGDPIAALNHFISLLDVKDANVKCFNRGHFEKISADIMDFNYFDVSKKQKEVHQAKLSKICESLTAEQVLELQDVLDFVVDFVVDDV